jgi:drug/metabolite transporter (DMT)-like permease
MTADFLGKILALSSAILWAIAVIFFKRAGEQIRPVALNLYKTIISTILLLPVLWITGVTLVPANITIKDFLMVVLSGILGIALADSLFFKCLNLLGAGLTAIVECMYSPMVILLSWMILLDELSTWQIGGGFLVVVAVLVATLRTKNKNQQTPKIFLGFLVGASSMFTMALSIILMRPVLEKTLVFWVTELRLLSALIILIVFFILKNEHIQFLNMFKKRKNWRYAFPGTILGNFLAMTCWVAGFQLTEVSSAAILNQTNTIFLVILSSLILREPFTIRRLVATVLAITGSMLVLLN